MNPYEENAREKKCRAFVKHIMGETVKIARDADNKLWANTARLAGLTMPSEESKKRIIELLEEKAK